MNINIDIDTTRKSAFRARKFDENWCDIFMKKRGWWIQILCVIVEIAVPNKSFKPTAKDAAA